MKKLFLFVFALFAFNNMQAQQKKWTLQECVQHALENNISVKQSQLDVEFTEIAERDALGNFIPSLNINSNLQNSSGLAINPTTNQFETTRFTSFSGSATTALTLFDGLRNLREMQRSKLATLATQYSLELMKDDIALFVANSYLQVLFNKQALEVLMGQNEVTQEQMERTRELVEAGVLPKGDLLEIEATNADEQQRIIIAENNIEISLISLAQTLLIKDYENFDIVEYDYDVYGEEILLNSPAEIIRRAKEERYEIRVAEENKRIAEKDVQLARGAYYPTLNAFFNYNTRYADNDPFRRDFVTQLYENDGTTYGLQLNIPVLNGFATRNQVRRSQINVERAEYRLEQAELDLESNVYQAIVDARGALKAYEAAQAAQRAQELAFEYATERYGVGLTNAFDFSQSKFRYENAQTEVVRTKYDYIFKLKVIELYFGIPVGELKF
ncbi:TolC family protein [Antarcticibacterium flavum]|uniref:TolC family protein n=1 Tax=Antarcticibacterium flavum TaxID=2058175 RepID=A0A5B7X4X1_9FLAO|nr:MULTISPECIES: TolC family protein [Antarcticibacterium]MCM4158374.1 transporter [Antarcticibacterium sp. W02-3]QCY70135.1 TolC family protein [Antarcticibacterium flavum]